MLIDFRPVIPRHLVGNRLGVISNPARTELYPPRVTTALHEMTVCVAPCVHCQATREYHPEGDTEFSVSHWRVTCHPLSFHSFVPNLVSHSMNTTLSHKCTSDRGQRVPSSFDSRICGRPRPWPHAHFRAAHSSPRPVNLYSCYIWTWNTVIRGACVVL